MAAKSSPLTGLIALASIVLLVVGLVGLVGSWKQPHLYPRTMVLDHGQLAVSLCLIGSAVVLWVLAVVVGRITKIGMTLGWAT